MEFLDNYNFENLSNEAERIVIDELGRQLSAYRVPICRCNDCVVDMAAMALNGVKPLYRSSLLGTLYTGAAAEDKGYSKAIEKAVKLAIEKVSLNPGHA
ncbi:hypothetical protein FACS1894190_03300 [Spirochaetia bacterium]|nr:hypothetical protein FACS1894190_03300 [Spirochaetia bacterium]GHV20418.1 hypothetical protein FACS189494_04130 [Spirochaetia bacterium]